LVLLGVGLAVTVVAYRVMIALGRLPDERRWFA
jgi:tight adherence protein B